ncbi:nitroreductase family protein [Aquirufa regiilacus]|uniref:Nitroreductase family protein n=1 Tax=Aquirufa regiilacus TaxID=3024868 RepID=A0ABU3TST1_9BACT|nr:nitroreductase family protein [Aquirufa sp. LEOWEIH-7C]MDU0808909.1 nitroreductase family protein [Aquirufa sp. LEOWEIH-7C]
MKFVRIIKLILPVRVFEYVKQKKVQFILQRNFKKAYEFDMKRYLKYSDSFGTNSAQQLIGKIVREYHVIEKGLTMPDPRLGFGKDLLLSLVDNCMQYIQLFGEEEEQLRHAVGVIWEYEQFHEQQNFNLEDSVVVSIQKLKNLVSGIPISKQKEITANDYFKYVESEFPQFAKSRSSLRNYTNENVPMKAILSALDLARTTPSACNRQSWRTYVFEDKIHINSILTIQGGNRGFGHLTNKLIIITSEISVFSSVAERNQVFIDGGMYAMNLLYALHYYKIGACILNCSNSLEKDLKLRVVCDVKESEVFIAMVSCGIPPVDFKIASSYRYELLTKNTIK